VTRAAGVFVAFFVRQLHLQKLFVFQSLSLCYYTTTVHYITSSGEISGYIAIYLPSPVSVIANSTSSLA
jgi:hypothetical protein